MSTWVEQASALRVATVESVAPDLIKATFESDAPAATALNSGQPTRFPRINAFLLIPNETGAVVGLVSWLGIDPARDRQSSEAEPALVDLPYPRRRLAVTPVGTLVSVWEDGSAAYEVRRGVASFPSVGDPVLLPTTEQLRALVEAHGANRRVRIGTSPLGAGARVSVDPDKLFGRHLAILGNTGSGKSCSVAGLIRWSLEAATEERETSGRGGAPNARFIVLDPNGEYRKTFADLTPGPRVFQAPPAEPPAQELKLPAWVWNSHEWAGFAQAAPGAQRPLLLQGLRNLRAGDRLEDTVEVRLSRLLAGYRSLLGVQLAKGPAGYSGFKAAKDTGGIVERISSDASRYLDELGSQHKNELEALITSAAELAEGHRFDWKGTYGYNDFSEGELAAVAGDLDAVIAKLPTPAIGSGASEDAPVAFDPEQLADHLDLLAGQPEFSQTTQFVATLTMRIRSMLADRRLGPIVNPESEVKFDDWLNSYIGDESAQGGQIAVIDLSLVPADVLHVVTAVIARVVFEAIQRYRRHADKELPTVLVLEEAHSFIQQRRPEDDRWLTPASMCRATFERIAREGRKFGLGLVLSSQRPSELSATALAQCNTFLLHRIVNDRDQDLVGRLVPDNLGGLLRELPNLPSQQAIMLGWATPAPVLVHIRHLEEAHRPSAPDPAFWDVWIGSEDRPLDWAPVVREWTGTPDV